MTVAATKENWTLVMEAIEELLDSVNCPIKSKFQILTAAEEIYVNIASYAYGDKTGEADIDFFMTTESQCFLFGRQKIDIYITKSRTKKIRTAL